MKRGTPPRAGRVRHRAASGGRRYRTLLLTTCLSLVVSACSIGPIFPTPHPTPPPDEGYKTLQVDGTIDFRSATVYYPSASPPALHSYPAVALSPGAAGVGKDMSGWAVLLARHGYVAIAIDTMTFYDPPQYRAVQLLAALDHVTNSSSVAELIDPSRQAVMGHSLGGGGALNAALLRPSLSAAIPMSAWTLPQLFPSVEVPTMFVACQDDPTAPVALHAWPVFLAMSAARNTSTAYVEVAGGNHECDVWDNPLQSGPQGGPQGLALQDAVLNWLDHFVKGDTSKQVCPPVAAGGVISKAEASCL